MELTIHHWLSTKKNTWEPWNTVGENGTTTRKQVGTGRSRALSSFWQEYPFKNFNVYAQILSTMLSRKARRSVFQGFFFFFCFFKLSLFPFGQTSTISSMSYLKVASCLKKICFQRALILVMQGLRGKIVNSLDSIVDSKIFVCKAILEPHHSKPLNVKANYSRGIWDVHTLSDIHLRQT